MAAERAAPDPSTLASTRRLRRMRLEARAPRAAVYGATALLALLGARTVLAGPRPVLSPPASPCQATHGRDAAGFAEAFVRAYLTYDAKHPDAHAAGLRPFLAGELDPDAGIAPAPASQRPVVWTATAGETADGPHHTQVTVAAALAGESGLRYVAVPVSRAGEALIVDRYPALVGGPPSAADHEAPSETEVSDDALRTVVKRALANYLSGATENLGADLAAPAPPVPPAEPFELETVDSITWAGPGRVAVQVVSRARTRARYTLRYELAVVKRDRWYVRGINASAVQAAEEGAPS